ncbi:MAG: hypothetical protein HY278_04580 [candidate division NC10 bacterium]|nr:hypothetical protein [candidate division NC10 bacterium]
MYTCDLDLLVPLSDVTSVDEAGSKAVSLAELARGGIPVPVTFVLPTRCTSVPGESILEALGGCVAVRSSATAEDLVGVSFAGQFKSFLNIRTVKSLDEAVLECRASAHSEAVRAYCSARGIDASKIRMAVIIQRMVNAEVAGVLFTVHPVNGSEDEMLIEGCAGLADELLAGHRSGVQIPVRHGRATNKSDLLSQEQVQQLIEIGRRIQELKGAPQDIEWAIEHGRLYILQARPITRLCFAGIDGEWTNADFRDGGVSSDVVTPLVWSLYQCIWERALKGYLRELRLLDGDFEAARVFYGRPYWNLGAVKRCVMKLPGFVEREFDRDLAVQPKYSGDGARTPVNLWNILKAIPTVLAARRVFKAQEARDHELMGSDFWQQFDFDPRSISDHALVGRFKDLLEVAYLAVEENYFRTIFCASIAKLDLKSSIDGLPVSYCGLVGGLDGLRHFECVQELWQMANHTTVTLDSFLLHYGYHSRRELDLRIPRWSEEAEFIEAMVGKLVGAESPEELNRRQRVQFTEEFERAKRLFAPWRRRGFEKKLARLRKYLWLREQMRDLSTRIYALIRRFALEIGRRAAAAGYMRSAGDVFYLTYREIYEALAVSRQATVQQRRDYEQMYRNFVPPNEVGRGFALAPVENHGHRLMGIGCSTGVTSGRVRVVTTLENSGSLERGDVLVCPFTDPGWTPLLNIAGAVVTETGGLLSHAAVICREYGIPAVLNVAGATRILRDGQVVRVDGENGYVDLSE